MEKGQIEFWIKSLELGGNSEQNDNVQIFFFINSNCTYLRPFEKKNAVAQWRLPD